MDDESNKNEPEELRQLSRKEVAREFRKQAYKKAKERQKSDPKFLAQKERAKEMRKSAYQAAKTRNQEYAKKQKEKNKLAKQAAVDAKIKAKDKEILEALEKLTENKPKLRAHLTLVKSDKWGQSTD